MGRIMDAGKKAIEQVGKLNDRSRNKSFISRIFAGQAVGTNLVGRQSGMVVNPNLTVLFSGPTLRSFNFAFH